MFTLLAALAGLGTGAIAADRPADAPVRLWMNNDRRYRPGDRVRLQVDAEADGYLLVLHYDPEGRVRVLFPLDPRDDDAVQAGRRYEVRDSNDDGAFRAYGDGTGLIYTAISPDPWRFDQVTLADRWDYTRLEIDPKADNPEQELTNMLQGIAGPRGFDYDVMGYRVYGESAYGYTTAGYAVNTVWLYNDLYCNNWYWRYDNCRRWPYDGGWAFGWGYDPYWYGYRYGYYGGYYGRYNGGYYGGYYGYPYGYPSGRPVSGRTPVVVGRPRGYDIRPLSSLPAARPAPNRDNNRFGDGIISRSPGAARGPGGDRSVAPPARRARPDGVSYPMPRDRDNGGARQAPRGGNDAPSARRNPPAARPSGATPSGGGGHAAPPSSGSSPRPRPSTSGRPRP